MADPRFFTRKGPFTLADIAKYTGAELHDKRFASALIEDVAALQSAQVEHVSFFSNPRYLHQFQQSQAGACFVEADYADDAPEDMALLISKNAYASYALAAGMFYPEESHNKAFVHPTAIIDPSAKIGESCYIDAAAIIGPNVEIGDDSYIGPHCIISKGVIIGKRAVLKGSISISCALIGDDVLLHPGVRIGQDGFGFAQHNGKHLKIPQLGRVIIGNQVEIGANSCIDRGAGPDTVVGDQCKIDNLVQIGHNVTLGHGCIVVAQVGVAGSTSVGDYVVIGGQVGISGHLSIGSFVHIAAQSGVIKDIEPRQTVGGYPAIPIKQWHRQSVALKRLIASRTGSDND